MTGSDLRGAIELLDQAIPKVEPADHHGVGARQHVRNIQGRLEGIRAQLAKLAAEEPAR